jgi:hypothetical protein
MRAPAVLVRSRRASGPVDRLTPSQRDASAIFLGEHGGWGLGMEVPAAVAADEPLPCGIGWDGGTGNPGGGTGRPARLTPSVRKRTLRR